MRTINGIGNEAVATGTTQETLKQRLASFPFLLLSEELRRDSNGGGQTIHGPRLPIR
jgi:hypothetical protein